MSAVLYEWKSLSSETILIAAKELKWAGLLHPWASWIAVWGRGWPSISRGWEMEPFLSLIDSRIRQTAESMERHINMAIFDSP